MSAFPRMMSALPPNSGHTSVRAACPLSAISRHYANHSSITSVADTSKVVGNVSPSAFAVFLFKWNSIFVGSSTGISAGLAPFRNLIYENSRATTHRRLVSSIGH